MQRFRLSLALFFLSALVVVTRAQSIRWEPSSGTLAVNKSSELQLVFENCKPKSIPEIPSTGSFTIKHNDSIFQNATQTNSGQMIQHVIIGYTVQPSLQEPVTLPAMTIETDKGPQRVTAARFDVVPPASSGLDKIALAHFDLSKTVWAGEVFPIVYNLSVVRDNVPRDAPMDPLNWKPAQLTLDDWSQISVGQVLDAGDSRLIFSQSTRGYAKTSGSFNFDASTQRVVLIVPGNDPWRTPTLNALSITSNRPSITVKSLPAGAPAVFNGAVGKFTLESKIVPVSANVGDPITWTLTLAGTGNWPDIAGLPSREASKDFRVIQPQAKRTNKEGTLFDSTLVEDVVLIPTKPGTYTLGPVSFAYFDPAKGEYQTVTAPRTTITITPPAIAPSTATTAPRSTQTSSTTAPDVPKPPLTPPNAPAAIPRDPISGAETAALPLTRRNLILFALAPLIPLIAFWFILALRRAKQTDPLRPRREARVRLAASLAELRTTTDRAKISTLLQAWQRDTAVLWPLPRAVPSAGDFSDTAATAGSPVTAPWSTLWAEAERTLYRSDTPLPADWVARAESALAARPVKSFSAFSLFLPRNLLPFAAMLVVGILLLAPSTGRAQDTVISAYNRSDFAGAEKSWRDRLAKTPTDWIAHHNLALALAQQNRWQEAAAHAATAFVQHPDDASVRWHLALTLDKAGYTPTTISAFINPSPVHSVARLLSPAGWQRALIAASAVAALASALAIFRLHGSRSRLLKPAAWTLATIAILGFAASILSLRLFSPTDDLRAALVWKQTTLRSIPTEADTQQKTSPLAPGSVAVIDQTFLGWSRLSFNNGQTGWVRHEDIVRFWRTN